MRTGQMAQKCDYPFHLGITEAGPLVQGTVKSSIGLGLLLADGIGDTIRVSLTDTPVKEVQVAHMIFAFNGAEKNISGNRQLPYLWKNEDSGD